MRTVIAIRQSASSRSYLPGARMVHPFLFRQLRKFIPTSIHAPRINLSEHTSFNFPLHEPSVQTCSTHFYITSCPERNHRSGDRSNHLVSIWYRNPTNSTTSLPTLIVSTYLRTLQSNPYTQSNTVYVMAPYLELASDSRNHNTLSSSYLKHGKKKQNKPGRCANS